MKYTYKALGICSTLLFVAFYLSPYLPCLQKNNVPVTAKNHDIWITVWIHGTHICLGDPVKKGILSSLQQLLYLSQRVAHTFFYCLYGLHSIKELPETNRHFRFAEILDQEDPTRFQLEHFYTYGWSGNLSFQEREKEGAKLYHQLIDLIALYEKLYGEKPHIRIISHSHGGNIALNMVAEEKKEHKGLVVDEVIFLAIPVQQATMDYAQSPMFKKIYSLYTKYDLIQRLDPQRLYAPKTQQATPFFSQQRFPAYHNLMQKELTVSRYGLPHVEILSERFIRALPGILITLDEEHKLIPAVEHHVD